MATFSEIQDEVKSNLIDAPTAIQTYVPSYINRALKRLQGKHNFIVMKGVYTSTTVTNTRTLTPAVPADFKEFRGRPYFTTFTGMTGWLDYAPDTANAEAYRSNQSTGGPQIILRGAQDDNGDGAFLVYPLPDGGADYGDGEYRITIPYWKYLPALSGTGDHNWFTDDDLTASWIIADATARGFAVNEDETRAEYWRKLAEMDYQDLLLIDKRKVLSGLNADTLPIYTDVNAPRISR